MNNFPFIGPGGQKTLHRQAADTRPLPAALSRHEEYLVHRLSVWAEAGMITPQQAYAAVMKIDNR